MNKWGTMPIKSILTLITGEEADLPTLQHAVQQAKNHQAQLQILHVKPDTRDMLPIIGDGMSGLAIEQMITSVLQSADERAKKAKATADLLWDNSTTDHITITNDATAEVLYLYEV